MPKTYDLEERTLIFAKNVRDFARKLPKTVSNNEDIKQLIRSSGSIGANYREANDCLGKKDFAFRIRIAKKEAKESIFWLELIYVDEDKSLECERNALALEATELMKILGAILLKCGPVSAFHA